MKWKLWLQQLSVSGPRVAVRAQLPWPFRAFLFFAVLTLAVVGGSWIYGYARSIDRPDPRIIEAELEKTRDHLQRAIMERDLHAATVVQRDSQLQIDRIAQQELEKQLKTLEADNAKLKADLSFFESLLPTQAGTKGVVIRSFRLQPEDEPNRLRYRLLVQQSGRPERDFVGDVSLIVNLQQGGRGWVLTLPDTAVPDAGPVSLAFRHYQRLEGSFTLPPGAVVRSVMVKIKADGQTQAEQTFSM
jgi:hypothetical protein